MTDTEDPGRDLRRLVLPEIGGLAETGDAWEPYRLLDADGAIVQAAEVYFADLQASGNPASTLRSYGMDLLRWWRFLWALGIAWDRASREEGRDFARWMQLADKPVRVHWRHRQAGREPERLPAPRPAPGTPNLVTGKPTPGRKYAASTRAHSETVLRGFYDFHLDRGTDTVLVNPFPLDRSRRGSRAHEHHNPMDGFAPTRTGRYRPKVPKRIPKRIPDDKFNEIFAGLRSNRDRALLASWVSTGARADELLDSVERDALPGQQLISVTRKGTGDVQLLPASTDSFVWLRIYQHEIWAKGAPHGRDEPLWWTLRRPWRPLNYPAARQMFNRANQLLGSNWTLHDLRHTAAFRMAEDPEMSLTHVQWVLAHARLTTTQIYTTPSADEVIASALAHHARQARRREEPQPAPLAPGYNPDSLNTLFGGPPA